MAPSSYLPQNTVAVAAQHHIVCQVYDQDAYALWNSLRRQAKFSGCRQEIYACIKAPTDVFTWFYDLRTDPRARDLANALHMSIQFVPPIEIWDIIVQIRRHPKWSSIRNLILSEMAKANASSLQPQVSMRSSDGSQYSRTPLSIVSTNSTRTSGISSSTGFTPIEEHQELGSVHRSDKMLPELPEGPATHAPAKGYRKAPTGHRFACPLRQCKGRWAFKRVGDYQNHMDKEHPWHYLREDLRVSTTPAPLKDETGEDISATTAPESPSGSCPEGKALSDAPSDPSEHPVPVDHFDHLDGDMNLDTADLDLTLNPYPNPGSRPLFGEVNGISMSDFQEPAHPHQQNFFYHEDNMQTG
jgi:hypothetical protein